MWTPMGPPKFPSLHVSAVLGGIVMFVVFQSTTRRLMECVVQGIIETQVLCHNASRR